MNQISDAEVIFGAIAVPMNTDETRAASKMGDSCLVWEVDWQKRTVKCLVKLPIDNGNKPAKLVTR